MPLPNAERVNFWKSGSRSPDAWLEDARRQITKLGGQVQGEAFGTDADGRAAYMLAFTIGDDRFKIVWPVLPAAGGNHKAARIQAATMLFHYTKMLCLAAVVLGPRSAFFSHLLLPDGRTAAQVADPEIADLTPEMFRLPPPQGRHRS